MSERSPKCPICQMEWNSATPPASRPFCSPRCKKLDLANWLEGRYCLPRDLTPEDLEGLSPEEQAALFGADDSALN